MTVLKGVWLLTRNVKSENIKIMKITKFAVNVAFFTDESLINACNLRVTKKARENCSGEMHTIFLFNLTFLSKIARKARKL